jgi:hypothetical protein
VQDLLIARCARLLIVIGILERRLIETGDIGDLAARQIIAFHNARSRRSGFKVSRRFRRRWRT